MSTLVAVGAGFAGSNLAEGLSDACGYVAVLDNMHTVEAYTFNQTIENANELLQFNIK
ncbi:MAG: hypothetical protein PHF94_08115 [Methanothrix sp.]|nr:hypothetical protein [Methanothrix sp.]